MFGQLRIKLLQTDKGHTYPESITVLEVIWLAVHIYTRNMHIVGQLKYLPLSGGANPPDPDPYINRKFKASGGLMFNWN